MGIYDSYKNNTTRSQNLSLRAKENFPGGVCHNIRGFNPYPFFVTKAKGPCVTDADGRDIIDLWMGHYTMILGHAPDEPLKAVRDSLEGGWHFGIPSEPQIELADELKAATGVIEKLRFCCTGTEATMYAIRVARAFTGKSWVLKVRGGWHGASSDLSYGVKSPFDKAEGKGLLESCSQSIDYIPFNDIDGAWETARKHKEKLAAIIIEPFIGSGGFIPGKKEYLAELRKICDEMGAVLIFDEIISGFRFRYGIFADEVGVTPDLVTLGKIVGGGFAIGAYGGRADVMACADPASKASGKFALTGGGTFSCNPVTLAGALATLRTLKAKGPEFYKTLGDRGEKLRAGIKKAFEAEGLPVAMTGKGSLFMTHLLKPGHDDAISSPDDISAKSRYEVADNELKIALINEGVFSVHGGGSISITHDDAVIDKIIAAYANAAKTLKTELA